MLSLKFMIVKVASFEKQTHRSIRRLFDCVNSPQDKSFIANSFIYTFFTQIYS